MKRTALHELFAELGDTAYIEENSFDESKIKTEALRRVRAPRRSLRTLLAMGAVAACLFALSLCAYANGGVLFGVHLFDETQREMLARPQSVFIASSSTAQSEEIPRTISGRSADILDIPYLEQNDILFFNKADTIAGTEDGDTVTFAEFVFNNGETAILTRPDGAGWNMIENDKITLSFRQNTEDNPHAFEDGNRVALGVIENGIPRELFCGSEFETEEVYTAGETGEVYFYVQDFSSEPVVIADMSVKYTK